MASQSGTRYEDRTMQRGGGAAGGGAIAAHMNNSAAAGGFMVSLRKFTYYPEFRNFTNLLTNQISLILLFVMGFFHQKFVKFSFGLVP